MSLLLDQEAKENINFRLLKVGVALLIAIGTWFALRHLPDNQPQVAAVFAFSVVLWATEALPLAVTAIMAPGLLVLLAGINEKQAFASFGNPVILLFIGSFTLAKAFEVNNVHERLAKFVLRQKFATSGPSALLLTIGMVSLVFSLFLSNTATTVMLLPIVVSLLDKMGQTGSKSKFAPAMMLMLTWSAAFAVGTPVATPPNLIALGYIEQQLNRTISFGEWMLFGMPISFAMLGFGWLVLWFMFIRKSDIKIPRDLDLGSTTKMHRGEWATIIIFGLVLLMWLAPDAVRMILGKEHDVSIFMKGSMTAAIAAVIGMALCYIIPARGTKTGRTLTWEQGKSIQWGTVMLFGGGLALGDAVFASGLAQTLGDSVSQIPGVETVWAVAFVACIIVVFMSELASNTASVTMLVPVVIGISLAKGIDPIAPVIATAIAGSFGFMLPVSTPPNAIVYGSGHVSAKQLLKSGVYIDIIGIIVTLVFLMILLPLMGLV